MTDSLELVACIDCANVLGEGIVWDDRAGCIIWTDIEASCLLRAFPPFTEFERFPAPERIGSFALLDCGGDCVLAAFETGFGYFAFKTGEVEWIDRPRLPQGARFNDGRVDRQGAFWAGVMIEDPALRPLANGALYRLRADGVAEVTLGDLKIPNSLCWSPDGATMYFADSPTREIARYGCADGEIHKVSSFARTCPEAVPDGSTVDMDGCLWNAEWGTGRIVRYTPHGTIDFVQHLPAPHVTCPSFGGEQLDLLFVTSARADLSEAELELAPQSGSVFVYKTPFRGMPEMRCKTVSFAC